MMMAFGDRGANRPIGGFPAPRRLCRDEVVREGLATAREIDMARAPGTTSFR
jgi:hypothetical protein